MNGGKQRHKAIKGSVGYTILEVMIVLAVSGLMFIIAANFISGKQGRTAFTEGVNELASTLQDTVEGVTNGQYTDIKVNCQFTGASTIFPAGANGQGTNSSCVFLGKVLHFREHVNGAIADQQYEVLSLAGGRVDGNKPITQLSLTAPAVIPSLTSQGTIPQRLNVTRVRINNGAVGDSYGVAFIQGLGATESSGDLQNGSQSVGLWYVDGLHEDVDRLTAPGLIDGTSLNPANRVDICISDGVRYATITMGINSNQLSVTVDMHGETNTC